MKFLSFKRDGRPGVAVSGADGEFRGRLVGDGTADLDEIIAAGSLEEAAENLRGGEPVNLADIEFLPPVSRPSKILCIGLNYEDHSAEAGFVPPDYPAVFARFPSCLIGHKAPIIRPSVSEQLDYEGEMAVVIGRRGRRIRREDALDHVAGYSIFNDASIRDYQLRTEQWTIGKNFDDTGAFGPYLVTPDELPAGASGLQLETRVNGEVRQSANTVDLLFDIADLVSIISEAMTFEPGDVVVTGTPAGVALARDPQTWMKHGDVVEVEIEGLGTLSNPIVDGP